MHNILFDILEKKRKELEEKKKTISTVKTKEKTDSSQTERKFKQTISESKHAVALIAEIKLASPTNPSLGSESDLTKRASEYQQAGADAISIVVEKHFFKGDIAFIPQLKKTLTIPILMKDFVIDEHQIYEAKMIGSDAILLIARLVDAEKLKLFVEIAKRIGIEPVVEVHNETDLEKAKLTTAEIIAVNARNLENFAINIDKACELVKKIPENFIKLGFSGIGSVEDVKKYKMAGVRGVLVGTSLMKTANITDFISSILAV